MKKQGERVRREESLTRTFNEAMMRPVCLVSKMIMTRGGGTPIHYLYRYVPPNGVVILKLLI